MLLLDPRGYTRFMSEIGGYVNPYTKHLKGVLDHSIILGSTLSGKQIGFITVVPSVTFLHWSWCWDPSLQIYRSWWTYMDTVFVKLLAIIIFLSAAYLFININDQTSAWLWANGKSMMLWVFRQDRLRTLQATSEVMESYMYFTIQW